MTTNIFNNLSILSWNYNYALELEELYWQEAMQWCQWKRHQRLTFRFRNFSVSKLLPNLWGFRFRFRKIWFRKKSLGFGFKRFGLGKNFRFRKIWSRKKSLSLGFGKFGLGKEKIQIIRTVLVMMSQVSDLVSIGTKALKWSHISPNSACKSQISSLWQDAKLSPTYPWSIAL